MTETPGGTLELELELTSATAQRLPRLRAVVAAKQGRAQSRPVRWIWHDGADAELARAGLALVEGSGRWHLERLRPGPGEAWPPGAPPPRLSDTGSLEALRAEASWPLPESLVPWAAFEGRALRLSLKPEPAPVELTASADPVGQPADAAAPGPEPDGSVVLTLPDGSVVPTLPDGSVVLTLVEGSIRTVARESRQCRLRIAGPAGAAANLALWLAGEIEIGVPTCSLADRALTAARGTEPAPRRLGAPVLAPGMSVAASFAYVVGHLADVILHFAPIAAECGLDNPEAVHQMRVATRRLRSAIAVFGRAVSAAGVQRADTGLRQLASTLGPARDWDVFTAGTGAAVGLAFADDEAVGRLLEDAERRRRAGYEALREFVGGTEFRRLGIELAILAANAAGDILAVMHGDDAKIAEDLRDFAARALNRRLKRMFAEGGDVEHLPTETLHDIRLRAKRLRYACEFFAPIFPHKPTSRFIRRLSALQERLGILNDGAVIAELLAQLERSRQKTGAGAVSRAYAVGAVRGFVAAQSGAVRHDIAEAWQKFHKVPPFWQ